MFFESRHAVARFLIREQLLRLADKSEDELPFCKIAMALSSLPFWAISMLRRLRRIECKPGPARGAAPIRQRAPVSGPGTPKGCTLRVFEGGCVIEERWFPRLSDCARDLHGRDADLNK
jgi:hypothetical protein